MGHRRSRLFTEVSAVLTLLNTLVGDLTNGVFLRWRTGVRLFPWFSRWALQTLPADDGHGSSGFVFS